MSVRVGDDFRIWYNSELYELLNDIDMARSRGAWKNVLRQAEIR